jgi:hypothetical protein
MLKLSDYIDRPGGRSACENLSEKQRSVDTIKSGNMRGATIALPARIALDERAARMNAFSKALVVLQYEDVTVIAVATKHGR